MHEVVQHVLMPSLAFGAPENMYVRLHNSQARALLSEGRLDFRPGGCASFDTFFNGMTVDLWKKHCALDDLHLSLSGGGRFVLRFGLHRAAHAHRWLDEKIIRLQEGEDLLIPLDFWASLTGGMLYFSLEAMNDASLRGGCLLTTTRPVNKIKLGIVITHYNRRQLVLPAIKRIQDELLAHPQYREMVELVVVDNSKNIRPEEAGDATLIPNRNLGGSGGFTRGFLYLKDHPAFTHCLFMDDDASCLVESIKRTCALLRFAATPRLAIAGSMLREVEPYRLSEKGARFDGLCRTLNSGLDMREVGDLLAAEKSSALPDYGGWWFFAFSIRDVNALAYPFFVRGDDIMFSIMNKFRIVTVNGIATWGEDFSFKSGPLPTYLDVRYHLLHSMVLLSKGRWFCARLAVRFVLGQLLSYHYASAKAARLAIAHLQAGPSFWLDNIDTSKVRGEINAFSATEKLVPLDRAEFNASTRPSTESRFRRLVRVMSLNGFLLPSFLLRDATVHQAKGFRASFRQVFRYRKVLYEYEPHGVGYLAEHNKRKFFAELALFLCQLTGFVLVFPYLKKEYQQAVPNLTSEAFWRKIYAGEELAEDEKRFNTSRLQPAAK